MKRVKPEKGKRKKKKLKKWFQSTHSKKIEVEITNLIAYIFLLLIFFFLKIISLLKLVTSIT